MLKPAGTLSFAVGNLSGAAGIGGGAFGASLAAASLPAGRPINGDPGGSEGEAAVPAGGGAPAAGGVAGCWAADGGAAGWAAAGGSADCWAVALSVKAIKKADSNRLRGTDM